MALYDPFLLAASGLSGTSYHGDSEPDWLCPSRRASYDWLSPSPWHGSNDGSLYIETNKRDRKYQARLNDTRADSLASRLEGRLCCWGFWASHGQTNKGFLILENALDPWAAINSWPLGVSTYSMELCHGVNYQHRPQGAGSSKLKCSWMLEAISEWWHVHLASVTWCILVSICTARSDITYALVVWQARVCWSNICLYEL